MPKIRFINIGGGGIKDTDEVPFYGDPSLVLKTYGSYLNSPGNIWVVDDYISSGKTLADASELLAHAFPGAQITTTAIFSKVPKWVDNPLYLGVREYTPADYKRLKIDMGTIPTVRKDPAVSLHGSRRELDWLCQEIVRLY